MILARCPDCQFVFCDKTCGDSHAVIGRQGDSTKNPRIKGPRSAATSNWFLTRRQIADVRESVGLFLNDSRDELFRPIAAHLDRVAGMQDAKQPQPDFHTDIRCHLANMGRSVGSRTERSGKSRTKLSGSNSSRTLIRKFVE